MSIDNEQLNKTAKLQKLMRDPVAVLALIAENERIDGCCKEMAADMGKLTRERNSFRSSVEKLKSENEALRLRCDRLDADKAAMAETHVLYTWLRKKCDQPSNDLVVVQMNIGHDWATVHDLDRDLRTLIEREEP